LLTPSESSEVEEDDNDDFGMKEGSEAVFVGCDVICGTSGAGDMANAAKKQDRNLMVERYKRLGWYLCSSLSERVDT
jgi:hypothetical protein